MPGLVAEFGEIDPGRPVEVLAQLELAAQPVLAAFLIADDEQLVRPSVVPHERRRYEVASISAI